MTTTSFIGGMNIEAKSFGLRRQNATIPFARLRITDVGLWLGPVALVAWTDHKRFGVVECEKVDVREVFRSRGPFGAGVGFDMVSNKTHYFWTFRPKSVLSALLGHGYRIGSDRRPTYRDLSVVPRLFKRRTK
jgi:hypothetical protein